MNVVCVVLQCLSLCVSIPLVPLQWKSYMCSSQGKILSFTVDFESGFSCSENISKVRKSKLAVFAAYCVSELNPDRSELRINCFNLALSVSGNYCAAPSYKLLYSY